MNFNLRIKGGKEVFYSQNLYPEMYLYIHIGHYKKPTITTVLILFKT